MLRKLQNYFKDPETIDVGVMYEKYNFPTSFEPHLLTRKDMLARKNYLKEELEEFHNAIDQENLTEAIDALIDIVVFAKGTAVMMGVEWKPHWDEVMRANMSKKPGPVAKRPDMPYDLKKPKGWVGPDHQKIIDRTHW